MLPSSEFFASSSMEDSQMMQQKHERISKLGDSYSDSGSGASKDNRIQHSHSLSTGALPRDSVQRKARKGEMKTTPSLSNVLAYNGVQATMAYSQSMLSPPPPPPTAPPPALNAWGNTLETETLPQDYASQQFVPQPHQISIGSIDAQSNVEVTPLSHAMDGRRSAAQTVQSVRRMKTHSIARPVSQSRVLLSGEPRYTLASSVGPIPRPSLAGRPSAYSRRGTNLGSVATDGDLDSTCSWGSDDIPEPEDTCDRGMAVSLVAMLMDQYDLAHKTVREVVRDFVLPETEESNMSVAGVMKRYYSDYVGNAGFYVSYPWDANFGRLVKALSAVDAAAGPGHYFWFDIFALDQHKHQQGYVGAEDEQWIHRDEMLDTVRYAITSIGRTVAFLDPPCAPVLVQRSWCLFECMQSLESNAELMLCVTPEPPDLDSMGTLSENIQRTIASFSPEFDTSHTSQERDKNWLRSAVAALHPGGSRYLNEHVGAVLLGWLCDRLQEEFGALSLSGKDITLVESVHRLALLCEKLDRVDEAESNLISALREAEARVQENIIDIQIEMVQGDDESVASSPQAASQVVPPMPHAADSSEPETNEKKQLNAQGADANRKVQNDLEEQGTDIKKKGLNSPETIVNSKLRDGLNNEGTEVNRELHDDLNNQGPGVNRKLHDDLDGETVDGDSDDQTQSDGASPHSWTVLLMTIKHDLACLWARNFDRLEDAEVMLREVLTTREQILGHKDSRTTESITALARLLQAKKKYDEAEKLFRRALSNDISTKGTKHRDTLVTANCLGLLLQKRGGLDEAKVLFERALQAGLGTLGPRHPDVLVWSNNLAVLYQDKKLYMKAERLFRKTLTHSEQELGPAHPRTLNIVYNLGHSLWQMGKLRAAETMFRRELQGCEQINGPRHRSTRRSIKNLAKLLRVQCRKSESDELLLRIKEPATSSLVRQLSSNSAASTASQASGSASAALRPGTEAEK